MNALSKALIIFGTVLILAGMILKFLPGIPWLGRLPGDICVKREHFSFYFPLSTCIIISILISLLLYILGKR